MKFVGIRLLVSSVALNAGLFAGYATSITLQPVADTSLIEFAPNNNIGGTDFFLAGTAGVNANGARNRALIRFDLSSIPKNSKIKFASLKLEVAFAPSSGESSSFALHRMLAPWGEGDKDSDGNGGIPPSPGLGFAATTNEATWNSPFHLTTNSWTSSGATTDYAVEVSSRTDVFGGGDFPRWQSTSRTVADVQLWLDNPAANFGWLLKTETEEVFFTARRFGSREFTVTDEGIDTNSPPFVEVVFIPPPVISEARVQSGQFTFSFFAEAGENYVVEFKNFLSATNSWQTLTNISALVSSTNILVSDTLSANEKFYRIVIP